MARGAVVLADHGSLSVSLAFFGPVLLMLAALAVMAWRERRRRATDALVEVEGDPPTSRQL
jgi:uncharacterized iron-regulated membrane protein